MLIDLDQLMADLLTVNDNQLFWRKVLSLQLFVPIDLGEFEATDLYEMVQGSSHPQAPVEWMGVVAWMLVLFGSLV